MGSPAVQQVLGFLIAGSSLMMLPPVLVSLLYQDGTAALFLVSAATLLSFGLLVYLPVRNNRQELRLRDGFLIVVGSWLVPVLLAPAFWRG
jgi:trk system potassium uptake protein TrkH